MRHLGPIRHLLLIALIAASLYPIFLMLITSTKDNTQFSQSFQGLVPPFHWSNYGAAWTAINPYLVNSVVVTLLTTAGVIACSALTGYAFARMRFFGKEILYYLVIALMMIPSVLTMVPEFILAQYFGLLDSWWSLILPYISGGIAFSGGGIPFTTFVLRSFFESLPGELFQAASLDGASELQTFWYLGLPLIRPAVGTVAILQILGTWNDYIWPSVALLSPSSFTIPVGLVYFEGHHTTEWGPLMAAYTLAAIPLVLLFAVASRTFIAGLTQGGLKL